ncbi:response regulator transcription factor [Lactobacillus sp. CC-MHH1034]|uniref:response regulator transcription factor n=1 Tax=Agrilactobacillus fermenti TaxID=2586909 RepID=UPI001E34AD81|nr:response regulator transcription factor [Agrilactobacillus fermenti]MCD2256081.1 response regulator transcription factor [Agrilactobacillus fermenti]
MNILIVEDNLPLQKIIKKYLERAHFFVLTAATGTEAIDLIDAKPIDLAVVDWMLPEVDGLEVIRYIQALGMTKTIMLTAKDLPEDEITSLKNGADDFIRKPFNPDILLLRIQHLLNLSDVRRLTNLTLNRNNQEIIWQGQTYTLTNKEFQLLDALAQQPGQVFSRLQLIDRIWGLDFDGDPRVVDTHVKRIREKVDKNIIKNKRGLGYYFEENA